MTIRRAMEKDIPAILSLLSQVDLVHHQGRPDLFKINTKYTGGELKEIFRDGQRPVFVCADEDDRVLGYGFCIFEQHPDDNILTDIKTLYIDDICVDEAVRGRGIGKSIYRHILAYAREQGCYHVTLNVWTLNPIAQKFYESCGMKPLKVMMETIL